MSQASSRGGEETVNAFHGSSILVTGGFGFVGGHMVRTLVDLGAEVTVFDNRTSPQTPSLINLMGLRDRIRIVQGDLADFAAVRDLVHGGEFRFIFNFAAYATVIERAIEHPYETIMANTLGWVNVMEAARTALRGPEMVFLSSTDKVYGEMEGDAYQENTTPLRGIGVYDAAKLAADVLAKTYHEVFGLPTVVLRMCNLFGPGDFNTDFRLIPKAMRNLFSGSEPAAPELYFDAIDHRRDYLHVDDAVAAILLLAANPACRGEVFNLMASEYGTTPHVLRIVVRLAAEVEREFDPELAEKILHNGIVVRVRETTGGPTAIKNQHLDGSKLTAATGFCPKVDFQTGLRSTVEWYRNHYRTARSA